MRTREEQYLSVRIVGDEPGSPWADWSYHCGQFIFLGLFKSKGGLKNKASSGGDDKSYGDDRKSAFLSVLR